MSSISRQDFLLYLESSFIFIYSMDKRSYEYYDPKISKDYSDFSRIIRSYFSKNKTRICTSDFFSNCNYDFSDIESSLSGLSTTDRIDVSSSFLKRIRAIGFRYVFSSIGVLISSSFDASAILDLNHDLSKMMLFLRKQDNLKFLIDSVDTSSPDLLESLITVLPEFGNDPRYFNILDPLVLKFKGDILNMKKFSPFHKNYSNTFSYFCKMTNRSTEAEYLLAWPEFLRNLYSQGNVSDYVAAHAESVWSKFNFEEYFERRLKFVYDLDFKKRFIVYSAVIISGKCNGSIARKIRSDHSKYVSLETLKILFQCKNEYKIEDWDNMIVKFCDSKDPKVIALLCEKAPPRLIPFFIGNKLSNRSVLARRMAES